MEKVNEKIERVKKYIKKEYNIDSIEQLIEDANKIKLDIGAFTMPFVIKKPDK